ncbi:MAG: hypothetical protein C5B53_01490 [Candidatus Melainabacteria bacterium]|nr:MAG: hypothetical protein C5B53_01490 [Candidatus Melainabacteria bacterium]
MKASLLATICLIFFAGSAGAGEDSKTTEPNGGPAAKSNRPVAIIAAPEVEKPKPYNKNALHRLDFRIVGKSCAVCLLGIKRRINALDGTVKVAIMLKKPYGASIIYDSTKLNEEKLVDTAKANEPLIKLLDIKDEAIPKLPVILVPPHSNVNNFSNQANSALLPSH